MPGVTVATRRPIPMRWNCMEGDMEMLVCWCLWSWVSSVVNSLIGSDTGHWMQHRDRLKSVWDEISSIQQQISVFFFYLSGILKNVFDTNTDYILLTGHKITEVHQILHKLCSNSTPVPALNCLECARQDLNSSTLCTSAALVCSSRTSQDHLLVVMTAAWWSIQQIREDFSIRWNQNQDVTPVLSCSQCSYSGNI